MSEKILCVLAGYDDVTEKYLSSIQQELYSKGFIGEHTRDIPMHITLGLYKPVQEPLVRELVLRAAEDTESFDVSLSHTGIFSGSKVIFIAPDITRQLLALKEYFGGSSGWVPHTTLLIDTPDNIYRSVPIITEAFKPLSAKIKHIYLYEFWPAKFLLKQKLKK
jgi:2'-5' RNA ligase